METLKTQYHGKTLDEAARLAALQKSSVYVCSWSPNSSRLEPARPQRINVFLDDDKLIERAWTIPDPPPKPAVWQSFRGFS